jgi:hypothetical protein
MKTKNLIIALAAMTLLSFTLVSAKKVTTVKGQNKTVSNESGFALQDRDQF